MSADSARSSRLSSLAALRSCSSSRLGGLLVELGRGVHLRPSTGLVLVGAGAEQLPESVAQPAGVRGLWSSARSLARVQGTRRRTRDAVSTCDHDGVRRRSHAAVTSPHSGVAGRRGGARWISTFARRSTGATNSSHRPLWVLKAFGVTAVCLVVVLVLLGRFTEWGRQFWRITGDVLHRPARAAGVADAGGAAAVGRSSRCGSACCSATTPTICSPSLQVAFEGSGSRRLAKRPGSTGSGRRCGSSPSWRRVAPSAFAARPVPDAAVHHAVAGVVDRPADRRLARRPRLLPRPVRRRTRSTTPTSASSRTSTSSPPVTGRTEHARRTARAARCCSAPSSRC